MVKNSKNLLIKLILLISIIALISAFFIEFILGHQPCNLCVLERIPYFLAIIVILLNKFVILLYYFPNNGPFKNIEYNYLSSKL